MERVSWGDAAEFCRRLTVLPQENAAKWRYMLPTEAQWEYACRAGNLGPRYFSDQPTPAPYEVDEKRKYEHCWFRANSGERTHRSATSRPTPGGFMISAGTCGSGARTGTTTDTYANSPLADPTGPPAGKYRVRRGIAFDGRSDYSRSAFRNCEDPGEGLAWVSRVVLVPAFAAPATGVKKAVPIDIQAKGAGKQVRTCIHSLRRPRVDGSVTGKLNPGRSRPPRLFLNHPPNYQVRQAFQPDLSGSRSGWKA